MLAQAYKHPLYPVHIYIYSTKLQATIVDKNDFIDYFNNTNLITCRKFEIDIEGGIWYHLLFCYFA